MVFLLFSIYLPDLIYRFYKIVAEKPESKSEML